MIKRKISRNGHSLSFFVARCHSLYHSLSLVVIRCLSLYHSLPFVVTRYHSLYHSLSLVVTRCTTRCTTRCHSLSLVVPLVSLFINDLFKEAFIEANENKNILEGEALTLITSNEQNMNRSFGKVNFTEVLLIVELCSLIQGKSLRVLIAHSIC